MIKVIKESKEK